MSNEAAKLAERILKRIFGTLVLRPLQRWNASNRATALVEKSEKQGIPVVKPPPFNATKEYLESLLKAHPEIVGEVKNPNTAMVERSSQLKVHVEKITSVDNVQADTPAKSMRPLPVSTRKITLGFDAEPNIVPAGKVTVSMATDIIRGHYAHPEDYPVEALAEHYAVDVEDVENLVEHYKPFHFIHNTKEELRYTDPEWVKQTLFSDVYLMQKADEMLDEDERALAEGRTFKPDMNRGSRLLRTPEYTEGNEKWLQDEDERWGRKKNKKKKLPGPEGKPLIDGAEREAQIAGSNSTPIEGPQSVDSESGEKKSGQSKLPDS